MAFASPKSLLRARRVATRLTLATALLWVGACEFWPSQTEPTMTGDKSVAFNRKSDSSLMPDAVKAYLASKGAKAGSVETMGAGKTQPVPAVKCDDKLPRKKLIECLAPNRRVVVEVQGPAK